HSKAALHVNPWLVLAIIRKGIRIHGHNGRKLGNVNEDVALARRRHAHSRGELLAVGLYPQLASVESDVAIRVIRRPVLPWLVDGHRGVDPLVIGIIVVVKEAGSHKTDAESH